MDDGAQPEVLFAQSGGLAHIVLNRPRVINALNHGMVTAISAMLEQWRLDAAVQTVLLTGSGDRGLCAGGDIVTLYHDAMHGNGEISSQFWGDEYLLNAAISNFPKPYVAIMDGIVLGGGIGLSAHASHRIVTERSKIGMPETAIGFFPDVGGTWLLSHAPGELGTLLALTGGSVDAADAIAVGLADSYVQSADLPALIAALEHAEAAEAIGLFATTPPASGLLSRKTAIDAVFSAPTVAEILRRLGDDPSAAVIASNSPTALTVTLKALRLARTLPSLEAALAQEFRMATRAVCSPDFAEGVRAQVIDKDRQPKWSPATLSAVDPAVIEALFEPLGLGELQFPTRTKDS